MDFAYRYCVILSALMFCNCWGQTDINAATSFTMKISPEQADQQFKLDSSRVLLCMASATGDNQKPSLFWEVNGNRITSATGRIRTEAKPDGSLLLRVNNVQDGDEGIYKCVATLGTQTDSRSIRVEVIKELEVLSKEEQWGLFGTDGYVMCEASSKPPASITWKFENGTNIESSSKYVIQADRLVIKTLNDDDSRRYWADIVVIELGQSKSFYVQFTVVHSPQIDMVPIISPSNPKEGDPEVKITCHATGIPQPTYQFKRAGNLLPEDMVDEVNGILTIKNLKREDQALYTCLAVNIGGSQEKSNFLDVKIPPTIADISDVRDAVEDGDQKVTCTAQGDPQPTAVWQKLGLENPYSDGINENGPEIIPTGGTDVEEAEIKTVGKIMYFSSITPRDVGTYICRAINIVGNASRTIKFEVKYKPTFQTSYTDVVFYGWRGHTSNLTCLASANEIATIQWYEKRDNNTIRIENEAPYTLLSPQVFPDYFLTSSSLMILVADDSNSLYKDYICQATNTMGTTSQTVTLKKAMPPGDPIVKVLTRLSTKVTLEFNAPSYNGGQPVLGYHYSYYPENDISSTIEKDLDNAASVVVVELTQLRANTNYVMKASGRNAVGIGQENTLTFQTKEVSKPNKLDILTQNEGGDPTSITLNWAEPDDGGSPITQYVISYRAVRVSGADPTQWTITDDIDKEYTIATVTNPSSRSYRLPNLSQDTYYDVRITAKNKEGESPQAFKIIKTSKGRK